MESAGNHPGNGTGGSGCGGHCGAAGAQYSRLWHLHHRGARPNRRELHRRIAEKIHLHIEPIGSLYPAVCGGVVLDMA